MKPEIIWIYGQPAVGMTVFAEQSALTDLNLPLDYSGDIRPLFYHDFITFNKQLLFTKDSCFQDVAIIDHLSLERPQAKSLSSLFNGLGKIKGSRKIHPSFKKIYLISLDAPWQLYRNSRRIPDEKFVLSMITKVYHILKDPVLFSNLGGSDIISEHKYSRSHWRSLYKPYAIDETDFLSKLIHKSL